MAPHLTETVFALGQGARVIAVGNFCDYPPEVAALPRAGGYIDPDLEKISMLAPDLLIVAGKSQKLTDYAALKKLRLLNIHMDSMDTIYSGIREIGDALGCQKEAEALNGRIKDELDAVQAAVQGLPRPKVFIVTTRQDHTLNNLYTANYATFVSELVECAGGANIYATGETTYLEASKETLVMKAPDLIIEFHPGEKLSEQDKAQYVADWSELSSIPAVRRGRIFIVTESHALRPGPRVAEIARILARIIHPEARVPKS